MIEKTSNTEKGKKKPKTTLSISKKNKKGMQTTAATPPLKNLNTQKKEIIPIASIKIKMKPINHRIKKLNMLKKLTLKLMSRLKL